MFEKTICLLLASTALGACAGSPAARDMADSCANRAMAAVPATSAASSIEDVEVRARAQYNAAQHCGLEPEAVSYYADAIVMVGKVKAGEMTRDELRSYLANRWQQANAEFSARNNDNVRAGAASTAAWASAWSASQPTRVYVYRK